MHPKPTPEEIRKTRLDAGLSRAEAAHLVGGRAAAWGHYETGHHYLHPAILAYLKVQIERHKGQEIVIPPLPPIEPGCSFDKSLRPSPDEIREKRKSAGLMPKDAANLIMCSVQSWHFYESGFRTMHPGIWGYFQHQLDSRRPEVTPMPDEAEIPHPEDVNSTVMDDEEGSSGRLSL